MHEPRARPPQQAMAARKNYLLTGRHLEQDQAHMRETLLLTAGRVKEGEGELAQKEGQKDKTDTCIMHGNTCSMQYVELYRPEETVNTAEIEREKHKNDP